jgi:hypothetical protein
MSFWQTSTGEAVQQVGSFESGGGALQPIPDGTAVLASAEEASWKEYQGDRYINIKWRIAKPQEYGNRVIFQKVRVADADSQKADRAKQMLAAISTNAGGALFAAMQKSKEHEPSDQSLSTLCNRPMVLKLGVWDMNGKTGNHVNAVSPAKAQAAAPTPKPAPQMPVEDGDIPF